MDTPLCPLSAWTGALCTGCLSSIGAKDVLHRRGMSDGDKTHMHESRARARLVRSGHVDSRQSLEQQDVRVVPPTRTHRVKARGDVS